MPALLIQIATELLSAAVVALVLRLLRGQRTASPAPAR